MVDKSYTIKNARLYLKEKGINFGENAFYKLIRLGEIAIINFGENKRFITEQALDDFIKKHTGVYKS